MLSTASAFVRQLSDASVPLTTMALRSVRELAALRQEWQSLFERCGTPCLFSSPTWHIAWWGAFQGDSEPYVITLRDAHSRLIGIAPLQLRSEVWRRMPVRVLGSYNNDHASRTNFLIDPAFLEPAVEGIASHLVQSKWRWDVLHLQQLPQEAIWVERLLRALARNGLTPFSPSPGIAKSFINLEETWPRFLANKSGHFRARHKENMRRVQKHGNIQYRRSSGTPDDFELLEQLERASWKAQDNHARLGPEGWAFQKEIALAKDVGVRCHNIFLENDNKVVGAIHVVGIGPVMYSMQMLFDESVRHLYPGRALFAVHIEDMFVDEHTQILDLNGNSPFCQSWTEQAHPFIQLQVFNANPYSRILALLKRYMGRNR